MVLKQHAREALEGVCIMVIFHPMDSCVCGSESKQKMSGNARGLPRQQINFAEDSAIGVMHSRTSAHLPMHSLHPHPSWQNSIVVSEEDNKRKETDHIQLFCKNEVSNLYLSTCSLI